MMLGFSNPAALFFGSVPQEARIVDKTKIKINLFMVLFIF
jgi:hypothetical protein